MNVRYMVELTDGERAQLQGLTGGDARVRRVERAQILSAAQQGCPDAVIVDEPPCMGASPNPPIPTA